MLSARPSSLRLSTGAAGFYALNPHNSWIDNAASGGFSGYTLPNAPRAIKDNRGKVGSWFIGVGAKAWMGAAWVL